MNRKLQILSFRKTTYLTLRSWVIGIILCISLSSSQQFTEVSVEMGVQNYLFVKGIAWIDYNNDNLLDLYLNTPGFVFPINGNPQNDSYNNLYENTGDSFVNVTFETNSGVGPGQSWSTGWADFNQDGWIDFYAVNGTGILSGLDVPNELYQNNGGYFTDVGAEMGVDHLTWGSMVRSVSWCDYDNNGTPDIFILEQIEQDYLYSNNGNGFDEVAVELDIIENYEFLNYSTADWGDYDNDGDLDLFIPVVSDLNRLFRNDLDITGLFTDVSTELGVSDPNSKSFAGNWVDYDNDGDLDLYVASYTTFTSNWPSPNPSRLYRNDVAETGLFTDVAEELGVADTLRSLMSSWVDYDNDGDLDLFYTNNYFNVLRLYRNDLENNTFTLVEELESPNDNEYYSTMAWGDYDNDGDMDLYVGDTWASSSNHDNLLFKNNQDDNNYLKIRFLSASGGYSRYGSRISVYKENTDTLVGMREIDGGGNKSQNMYDAHFGLDGSIAYDIVIRSTVRINGENIVLDKNVRPELGGVIPIEIGGFIEVRDSVDVSLDIDDNKITVPEKMQLFQNYPNPFNINTAINFTIPSHSDVQMSIYNLRGQIIKHFNLFNINQGNHSIHWNGVDENGNELPSGIYLYELKYLGNQITKKMVLMK